MWSMVFFSVGEVGVVKWKKKKGWKGEGDDYGLQKSEEAERRGEGRGRGGGFGRLQLPPLGGGGGIEQKNVPNPHLHDSPIFSLSPRATQTSSHPWVGGWGRKDGAKFTKIMK